MTYLLVMASVDLLNETINLGAGPVIAQIIFVYLPDVYFETSTPWLCL